MSLPIVAKLITLYSSQFRGHLAVEVVSHVQTALNRNLGEVTRILRSKQDSDPEGFVLVLVTALSRVSELSPNFVLVI